MKTYNEMAVNVLNRIDEYETKQEHRKSAMKKVSTGLLCACIMAMVGFGAWQIGTSPSVLPQTDTSSAETESTHNKNNDVIIINHSDDSFSNERAKMNICLFADDYVQLSKQQLNEYYGLNIFPTVPADLEETDENWEEGPYGIYKRDGGKGEVYYDAIVLDYSNKDFSRGVNIELQTGSLPLSCYGFFYELKNESVINNVKVKIAQSDNGYYYASFMYKNVGFRILGEGLSQEEFVNVILSITK